MPTVLRWKGFCVRIYLDDHLPAHVHVIKSGNEAKIKIGDENEPPEWMYVSQNMSDRDANESLDLVAEHQLRLLEEWRKIHGC